ncbi:MAG: molybdate ABC transporter substrate-binding protein [Halothece sp.]
MTHLIGGENLAQEYINIVSRYPPSLGKLQNSIMDIRKTVSFLSIGILSSLLLVGCNPPNNVQVGNSSQANPSTQLTVSAAASLKEAMEEIKKLYQEEYPDRDIIYNFGSSGSLQRQIEQGAPVDVFISAAVDKMDTLEEQGLILTGSRRDLLKNQMVLVTSASNQTELKLSDFKDLTTEGVTKVALGEPESVPAGKYAQQVLTSFKIAEQVNSKAVYGKDVRQILNYVATGNVDAGIIYYTDAQVSDDLKIVATAPETTHSPVIYPIAVIQDSDAPEAASELVEFLETPAAQAVFEEYGFVSVTNN